PGVLSSSCANCCRGWSPLAWCSQQKPCQALVQYNASNLSRVVPKSFGHGHASVPGCAKSEALTLALEAAVTSTRRSRERRTLNRPSAWLNANSVTTCAEALHVSSKRGVVQDHLSRRRRVNPRST